MSEPTLTQVFGANASQDANTITIAKADLIGLTASANNRAEQIFVGILLKAFNYLNPTNQTNDPDIQVTIEKGDFSSSIVFRNNANYRQDAFTVNLQKPDIAATIDPDDY